MPYTTRKLMADRQLYPFQQMLRNAPNQPNLSRNVKNIIIYSKVPKTLFSNFHYTPYSLGLLCKHIHSMI